MKRFLAALVAVALLAGLGLPRGAQATPITTSLYVCDTAGELARVDFSPGSATVHLIGNMGHVMTDIAIDGYGNMWAVDYQKLYEVNLSNAAATAVGLLGISGVGSNALTFGPGGILYVATNANTDLYTVNTGSGSASSIGNTGWKSSGDLEFYNPGSGLALYETALGKTSPYDELIQIPLTAGPTAGTAIPIGTIKVGTTGLRTVFGLASDDHLYGISGTKIYEIDPSTAAATLIADYSGHGLSSANGASSISGFELGRVPEPTSLIVWSAIGAAGAGLGAMRRRRRTRWSDENRAAIHQIIARARQ